MKILLINMCNILHITKWPKRYTTGAAGMWAVNILFKQTWISHYHFCGGGSRSPLPIFGPSGLIEGIHISKNCQNNYQLCLDFSSLFLQGTDVIPRHPYLNRIIQVHSSIKLEFFIIIFALGSWFLLPLPPIHMSQHCIYRVVFFTLLP